MILLCFCRTRTRPSLKTSTSSAHQLVGLPSKEPENFHSRRDTHPREVVGLYLFVSRVGGKNGKSVAHRNETTPYHRRHHPHRCRRRHRHRFYYDFFPRAPPAPEGSSTSTLFSTFSNGSLSSSSLASKPHMSAQPNPPMQSRSRQQGEIRYKSLPYQVVVAEDPPTSQD